MAQFDVFTNPDGSGYLIDCQSDVLADLSTRLVAPLQPPEVAPKPAGRLNPTFAVEGKPMVMVTQFAATMPLQELSRPVASLRERQYDVIGALDVLLTGV